MSSPVQAQFLPFVETNSLLRRCVDTTGMNTCEKPVANWMKWAVVASITGLFLASIVLVLIWLYCRQKRRNRDENAYADNDSINDYMLDELEPTKPTRTGLRRQALIRLGIRKNTP
ncbi:unnamed protein product [Fusarium venenatum]|uniref:Uncharacterized protein n=1 Tax=Fusarium venenatum TaxID=56646 RepID=A0A2L2TRN5_9HYPO|nr:uncharacterized protein FVRRES_00142 [Fusarium venenatum]KAH7006604.1 hypothetical protein EDB82DRAFT_534691 [Fusarium venenatum]CEI63630.1 unnamed protein product [Fusarium venenatum]